MAYGFNNDKSKGEIKYAKLKTPSNQTTTIAPNDTGIVDTNAAIYNPVTKRTEVVTLRMTGIVAIKPFRFAQIYGIEFFSEPPYNGTVRFRIINNGQDPLVIPPLEEIATIAYLGY